MHPLFSRPDTDYLEKLAFRTKVGSNPANWGTEVLDAVYSEHPYLKAYAVDVSIKNRDEGSGTAVGSIAVYPTTMTKEAAAAVHRVISLPVIIRDRQLAPLDVYMDSEDGTPHPASQAAIESTLHSPELFEEPEPPIPGLHTFDQGNLELSPPSRNGTFGGNANIERGGAMMKAASVWEGIGPRLDLVKIAAYLRPVARQIEPLVRSIASAVDSSAGPVREADVTQVTGAPGSYMVKVASRGAYAPSVQKVSDQQAKQLAGSRFGELAERGYVTFVANPIGEDSSLEKVASAKVAGVYEVSVGGRRIDASVFPVVRTLAHQDIPGTLVLGKDWFAEAEKVAGAHPRALQLPPPAYPSGRVVPVDGSGVAYEPLRIESNIGVLEKRACVATRLLDGTRITIHFEEGLHKIASVEPGVYLFPLPGKNLHFLPYPEREKRAQVDSALLRDASFDLRRLPSMVKVASDGEAFRVWGAPEIAGEYDEAGTLFVLGAVGIDPDRARGMLKHASLYREPVETSGTHLLSPPAPEVPRSVSPQSTSWRDITAFLFDEEGQELLKSAGAQLKGQSPSALLSLDFVTPETASLYASYLPDLEKAASHLAELLVASRLGYDDIRERSAKNAMTQLQAVVADLQGLQNKVH